MIRKNESREEDERVAEVVESGRKRKQMVRDRRKKGEMKSKREKREGGMKSREWKQK